MLKKMIAVLMLIMLSAGCADTTENDGNFENKRHLVKLSENESYSFTYSFKFF